MVRPSARRRRSSIGALFALGGTAAVAAALGVALVGWGLPVSAAAQEPDLGGPLDRSRLETECLVDPVPIEAVLRLVATPEAASIPASSSPEASPGGSTRRPLPAGPPADMETIDAVTVVWRQTYLCDNEGDIRKLAALFSDTAFRDYYSFESAEELAAALLVPQPLPEVAQDVAPPILDVRVLPDGRVGGVIDLGSESFVANKDENWVIFVQQGDRWLIDEVQAIIG